MQIECINCGSTEDLIEHDGQFSGHWFECRTCDERERQIQIGLFEALRQYHDERTAGYKAFNQILNTVTTTLD